MPRTLTTDPRNLYPPTARHYHSDLSIWLSVDPMSDKYPEVSPYVYCGDNPVRLVDKDGRDWFENEKTGGIYYSKDYHEGDEHLIEGNGWKWMGENGMFGKSDHSIISAHLQQAEVYAGETILCILVSSLSPQKWHRHSGFQTFFYGKMGEVIEKSKGVSNILQKSVLLQL